MKAIMFVHRMTRITRTFLPIAILYWMIISSMAPGCANIIPPTGGPRDSLPPILVQAAPKDSTLQFKGNRIVLTFDEYVQLDNNLTDNLIVSPNPDNPPMLEGKLKTVTIKLKDSLIPNTTYSIDFGKAIKDVNEGNIFRNFVYVFSTGDTIHNAEVRGRVLIAETGEVDSTLIAVLHTNTHDSAVKKLKPVYYTRIDSGGNFRFRFLPVGQYSVFVVPNDFTKKYDDSTKMFAFADSQVYSGTSPVPVMLYAYQQVKPTPRSSGSSSSSQSKSKPAEEKMKVLNNLENNQQDLLNHLELTTNKPVPVFDSTRIVLTDTNYIPKKGYTVTRDTGLKKFLVKYAWPENEPFRLVIGKEAFADSAGVMLPETDTLVFTTRREAQYGSIRIHFNNISMSAYPVLQLVQNNAVAFSVPLTTNEWYAKLFEPGDYNIRILYDTNQNGKWDPGNYDTRLQPERVQRITRKLSIKANWDNEVDINL